jgi:hypothetical protein
MQTITTIGFFDIAKSAFQGTALMLSARWSSAAK